jgi:hypothetical protein
VAVNEAELSGLMRAGLSSFATLWKSVIDEPNLGPSGLPRILPIERFWILQTVYVHSSNLEPRPGCSR